MGGNKKQLKMTSIRRVSESRNSKSAKRRCDNVAHNARRLTSENRNLSRSGNKIKRNENESQKEKEARQLRRLRWRRSSPKWKRRFGHFLGSIFSAEKKVKMAAEGIIIFFLTAIIKDGRVPSGSSSSISQSFRRSIHHFSLIFFSSIWSSKPRPKDSTDFYNDDDKLFDFEMNKPKWFQQVKSSTQISSF